MRRQRQTKRGPCDKRSRGWSDVAARQGRPETGSHYQKLGRGKRRPYPESPRGHGPAGTLFSDFWHPDCERIHFGCFKPPSFWVALENECSPQPAFIVLPWL